MTYEKCKHCGKRAVHLATASEVTCYGDSETDSGKASKYAGQDITVRISLVAHVCFACGTVVDAVIEQGEIPRRGDEHEMDGLADLFARTDTVFARMWRDWMSANTPDLDDNSEDYVRIPLLYLRRIAAVFMQAGKNQKRSV